MMKSIMKGGVIPGGIARDNAAGVSTQQKKTAASRDRDTRSVEYREGLRSRW